MLMRTSWPSQPYKGLNYFSADDRPLFCERDEDVRACANLIAHFGTKMLLLHGRTGTGKSSFIRAGLFPKFLENERSFVCLADAEGRGPLLVRSTADPLVAISDMLRSRLVDDPTLQRLLMQDTRSAALALLARHEDTNPASLGAALCEALTQVTSELPGTLFIAIDQGEEIFTLRNSASDEARDAYFAFLETLCFEPLDVKILLAIRTEYYGQFSDRFRFGPDLTVSTVRSGLVQYMLHGIKEPARLVEAIVRPTLREPVDGLAAPFDAYSFSFEDGLPGHIATDVLRHCGESSTLPVLQLVCLDLWQQAQRDGAALITRRTYEASGGIDGAMDRFIEQATAESVRTAGGGRAGPAAISAWKEVLSTLVARQEGGALTSLLVPASELVERAETLGLPHARECLDAMARDTVRLLRAASVSGARTNVRQAHFSLGHDSLAPALLSFRESRAIVNKARESTRRKMRRWGIATALLVATAALFGWQSISSERAGIAAMLRYSELEPQVRLRLLTLLVAMRHEITVYGWLNVRGSAHDHITQVLARAPTQLFEVAAVGIDPPGERLAAVTAEGRVVVMTATGEVEPGDFKTAPPTGFMSSVGFLEGLSTPAVFQNGTLTLWKPGDPPGRPTKPPIAITSPAFPDISAGRLRLGSFTTPGNASSMKFADLAWNATTNTMEPATDRSTFTLAERSLLPVSSDSQDLFAEIENGQTATPAVRVGRRSEPLKARSIALAAFRPFAAPVATAAPGSVFVKAIAFVAGESTLVVRLSERRFVLFPDALNEGSHANGTVIEMTDALAADANATVWPLRPQFGMLRPLLAVARHGPGYRFAWISTQGVSVYETSAKGLVPLPGLNPLLASVAPLESISRLVFSRDGEHLFAAQYGGNKVNVRLWDLGDRHLAEVTGIEPRRLRDEVCRYLAHDSLGASRRQLLTPDEFKRFPEFRDQQVCD